MKPEATHQGVSSAPAFTLIELLVVLAVVTLLALTLVPAMAGTRVRSHQAQCLNNLKQLTRAWHVFADDNNGRLAGNLAGSASRNPANLKKTWALGWLSLTERADNNREDYLRDAQLGPYARDISIYRCPADRSMYADRFGAGPRVRSVSMNGYLGDPNAGTKTPGYLQYKKMASLTRPGPSITWVFVDQRDDQINDGFFWVDMRGVGNPPATYIGEFPALWHNESCSFSFADGRVEPHQWLDPRTKPPRNLSGLNYGNSSPNNADMDWLMAHSSAPE
jgi:prepilin-type N-terminal cleavage/methylation domain-containing protein